MPGRRDYLPPLLAFLVATAVAAGCAHIAGYDPTRQTTWARWDSIHYVSIARDGYVDTLRHCPGSAISCAHGGWLSGYPAVMAVPVQLGAPARATGIALGWAACLAALWLIWMRFPRPAAREGRLAVLAFAAFVPGWFYMHAIFPLSLFALLSITTLLLLERGRFVAAGLSGAAASATYPLGVLLAPVAALWLLLDRRERPLRERLPRAATAAGLMFAGFAAALVAIGLWTGDYFGYFHAQQHDLRDPVSGLLHEISNSFEPERGRLERARAAQALLTAGLAASVAFLLVCRRRRLDRVEVLAAWFALAVWVVPLTQAGLSVYRSNAALLPAAPLLRHLPPLVRWALAGAATAIGVPMAVLFFQSRLV
jgi:hypothetical protein